jgi:alpha-amylase/alpha-mannosidase (GH57 family)
MHQPLYRDALTGRYVQPWVYLHGIKDYSDMAWHLESVPGARVVVNFTPILLEQIQDYCGQFDAGDLRDPILRALQTMELGSAQERNALVASLFRSDQERMIDRFPSYKRLQALYLAAGDASAAYLDDQFIADLLVWYHLAWFGESVREGEPKISELVDKGENFTAADRAAVLAIVGKILHGIVPRYRALAERGQIELSTTPYAHPMLPLLVDLRSALEAMPGAPMPEAPRYPGGEARARLHLEEARRSHASRFGSAPRGCWPSEGGVSDAALALIADAGFMWAASGEGVLAHSFRGQDGAAPTRSDYLYRPYAVADPSKPLACFFRDDQLSDAIGFTYATWHGEDASNNLIVALEGICGATREQNAPVATIILDGENAWEHYPENGRYFIRALYEKLAAHPYIRMTTFSDYLRSHRPESSLKHVVAGSWVYGTLSTWIGSADKNLGWDELVQAKTAYDEAITGLEPERADRAEVHLRSCEGSDWFWWFGDYNSAQMVREFDQLYRTHLHRLYELIGRPAPPLLEHAISEGKGEPEHGGSMRRSNVGGG